MVALPSRRYSRLHKATEEDGHPGTPEKGIWRKNVDSGLQVKLEKDGGDSSGQSP